MIREALEDVGVPAVINGAGSVFGTDPARQWLRLLEALERPASITRAHSAALTAFVGWPAERLAGADEDSWEWEEVHRRLHDWARVLRTRGVASLLETVMRDAAEGQALAARVLGDSTGERSLTDLRHIGQLLHARRVRRSSWAPPRSPRGYAPASPRPRSTPPTRSAAAAWNRTPRRFRSSPSTAARAWSSPSSTCRSCGRPATSRTSRRDRCSSTTPRPTTTAPSTSPWRARTSPATRSSSSASSGARICAWPTWRSPARATRLWCGGRARSTVATRRWDGCCSPAPTAATWRPAAARRHQIRRWSAGSGRSPTPPAAGEDDQRRALPALRARGVAARTDVARRARRVAV